MSRRAPANLWRAAAALALALLLAALAACGGGEPDDTGAEHVDPPCAGINCIGRERAR